MKTAEQVKPNNAPGYCAIYPGMAEIFVSHGYALAIHGSMVRDFDLVAIPWVECPSSVENIIAEICKKYAIHYVPSETNPKENLHGRVCYTLFAWGDWKFDLSFMPVHVSEHEGL